jgi:AraC-like DNA-binding protein
MEEVIYYPPENAFSSVLEITKLAETVIDDNRHEKAGGYMPRAYGLDYVLDGSGYLSRASGKPMFFKKDCLILAFQGHWYSYKPVPGAFFKHIWIRFNGKLAETMMNMISPGKPIVLKPENPRKFRYSFEYILEMSKKNTGIAAAQASGELCSLLAEITSTYHNEFLSDEESLNIIEKFRKYVDENTRERHFDVKKFLKMEKVGYESFRKKFKAVTGMYPYSYWLNRKLSMAQNMLENSERNISEIAESLNFANVYVFSSFFKRKTGVSPLQYRKDL